MKKQVLLMTLAAGLFLQVSAQTKLLTLAENDLKGSVKSISTTVNWMTEKFGELEIRALYYSEYCAFNKAGLLTASSKEESTKYKMEYSFKYDGNNQLVQKKTEYGPEKKKEEHSSKYVYDAQGRQTEINSYGNTGELTAKEKMKDRQDGKLEEIITYSGDGSLSVRDVYTYNELSQLISTVRYNPSERVIKTEEITYDKEGNKIKQVSREDMGKTITTVTYNWTYANGRKKTESKITVSNDKERRSTYFFDEWGNITKQVEPSGTIMTTVYTFDSNNNWITATTTWTGFDDQLVAYRKYREIKYY